MIDGAVFVASFVAHQERKMVLNLLLSLEAL